MDNNNANNEINEFVKFCKETVNNIKKTYFTITKHGKFKSDQNIQIIKRIRASLSLIRNYMKLNNDLLCENTRRAIEFSRNQLKRFVILFKRENENTRTRVKKQPKIISQSLESSFKMRLSSHLFVNTHYKSISEFLDACYKRVSLRLLRLHKKLEYPDLKVNLLLTCEFSKPSLTSSETIYDFMNFNTKNMLLMYVNKQQIREWYINQAVVDLIHKVTEMEARNSGWTLSDIISLSLHVNSCDTLFHSAGDSENIEVPLVIRQKKAVLNIKSSRTSSADNENACFFSLYNSYVTPG